jgi:hypothetical protein
MDAVTQRLRLACDRTSELLRLPVFRAGTLTWFQQGVNFHSGVAGNSVRCQLTGTTQRYTMYLTACPREKFPVWSTSIRCTSEFPLGLYGPELPYDLVQGIPWGLQFRWGHIALEKVRASVHRICHRETKASCTPWPGNQGIITPTHQHTHTYTHTHTHQGCRVPWTLSWLWKQHHGCTAMAMLQREWSR